MCCKYCKASGCYEKLYDNNKTYCSKHDTSVTLYSSDGRTITTTKNQRMQLADELNEYVEKTGKEWEYRVEVDANNNTKFGMICRPYKK